VATHILNRPDEAEDVVQEAFLRVYAQIGEFRGDARFYTLFYKILVHCALNRMRTPFWKREKEPLLEGFLSLPDAESEAEKSDTKLLAKHLLNTLSPPLRAAVVLREMEQRDYNEISEVLGIPVGTVRSRLNAAREQLRNLYQSIEKETENV
jgi:RNA polymerase sigma-70 factor (ECF subfamily)